jgi:hypothetical protein
VGSATTGSGGLPVYPRREFQVQIDPSSNVDAFTKLADKTDQVAAQVGVSLTKEVMDGTKDAVMELLGSLEPHLGQNVDLHL